MARFGDFRIALAATANTRDRMADLELATNEIRHYDATCGRAITDVIDRINLHDFVLTTPLHPGYSADTLAKRTGFPAL